MDSDRLDDARALLALVQPAEAEDDEPLGEGRMRGALTMAALLLSRRRRSAAGSWTG